MMKKGILLIACLLILGSCAAEKKLSFMIGGAPNELEFLEKITREFEEKEGMQVDVVRQTSDSDQRKQTLQIGLRGKKSDPDLMFVDVAWIGQFAASGWLLPLDKYQIDTSPFFANIIKLADRYQGKLIGLPVYVDGGLLYYRKDLLDTYDYDAAPQSWGELREMALKIQAEERAAGKEEFWGFVWQGAQYEGLVCNALEYFVSAGGGFINQQGNSMLDAKANQQALSFMRALIHEDKISPPNTFTDMKEEEVRRAFQSGNALFERNWPYAWALHNADDSPVKGKTAAAPLPYFKGHQGASTLGGWHAVVSAYSDRKEDAVKLLKYLTSYEVQKRFTLELGWNPSREDMYNDGEIAEKIPHLIKLKQVFRNAFPRPNLPYYAAISQVLQKEINAALAEKKTAEAALKEAHQQLNDVIKRYGN